MRLCGEVVDFQSVIRRKVQKGGPNGRRIAEICLTKLQPRVRQKMGNPLAVGRGTPANKPHDTIVLLQKELCEVRPILTCNACNDGDTLHSFSTRDGL